MKSVYRGMVVTAIFFLVTIGLLCYRIATMPDPDELATKHDVQGVAAIVRTRADEEERNHKTIIDKIAVTKKRQDTISAKQEAIVKEIRRVEKKVK